MKLEEVVENQVYSTAFNQSHAAMSHDFLYSLPVFWFVAMDLTVLAGRLGVKRAILAPHRGVAQNIMAFLAEGYVVFIGLWHVFVFCVAVNLYEFPEYFDIFIDL